MDVRKEGEAARRGRWRSTVVVGLAIVALSPLVLTLLVAYGIYAVLLQVLLWLLWASGGVLCLSWTEHDVAV
jgi:hypothetical protein